MIADSRTEKYEYLLIWKAEKKCQPILMFETVSRVSPRTYYDNCATPRATDAAALKSEIS